MQRILYIFVVILSLILVVKGSDVIPKNEAEERILFLLEKWRTGDVDAFPFPLPALDVIKLPALNGTYSGKGVKMSFSTSEMLLTGVDNFTVVELNVSDSILEASGILEIPILNITAENYTIDGRAYLVYKLKGAGQMNVSMNNIKLFFELRLGTNGTSTTLEDLQLDFKVGSIEVNLENSSWPINKVLNREAVNILNGYHDNIVNATKSTLTYYLNDYLETVSPQELLDTLAEVTCLCSDY